MTAKQVTVNSIQIGTHAKSTNNSPPCFMLQLKRLNRLTGLLNLFTDTETNARQYMDTLHVLDSIRSGDRTIKIYYEVMRFSECYVARIAFTMKYI